MSARAPSHDDGRAAARRPPVTGPPPLLFRGVTKRFGPVHAVSALDLVVRPGAVVGLIGPNGSGKTTALHIAAGLVQPDAGTASVLGYPSGSLAARRRAALVPDEPAGFDELDVEELVALVHALWGEGAPARARAALLLAAFGFEPGRGGRLGRLSRGRRRQAFAAAALSLAPALLLVDEATSTLDPESVVVLREAVAGLARRGTGVLVATQDLHFAAVTCDHLVLLRRGVVLAEGAPEVLCERAGASSLEEAMLVACRGPQFVEALRGDLAAL